MRVFSKNTQRLSFTCSFIPPLVQILKLQIFFFESLKNTQALMTRQLTEPHQNSPLATFCIYLSLSIEEHNVFIPFLYSRMHMQELTSKKTMEGDFR